MHHPVHLLRATDRCALHQHFAQLSDEDLLIRFGRPRDPAWLALVVEGLDFARNTVLGIQQGVELAAVAHLALFDSAAELGISVTPAHRRRGMASALFLKATQRARDHGVKHLYIRDLVHNPVMSHIAQRCGLIRHTDGPRGDDWLELPLTTAHPLYVAQPRTSPSMFSLRAAHAHAANAAQPRY